MNDEPKKASSRARSPMVTTSVVVSISLYLVSLTQDGFYIDRPSDPRAWAPCIGLFFVGWVSIVDGVFAWFANPALFLAWRMLWYPANRFAAAGWSITALALSLSF